MKLTRQEVEHVAFLSRLELGPDDAEKFADQLSSILKYVEMLNAVNTDGVEPTAHVLSLKNVMRPDEAKPSLDRAAALANAPEQAEGYFKVPKIMEG